jgi:hypothetical protein
MNWTLQCGDTTWEIKDATALGQVLKQLHEEKADNPTIVHLCAPDGACLNVAVGDKRSVLNYIAPGGWPARHSVGNEDATGLIQYAVAHEITEFPARCSIPFAKAMPATLHFYVSKELAEDITWEDD